MKNYIKYIFTFIAGAATGAAVTAVVSKINYQKSYHDLEKVCEKEIEDAKRIYDERIQNEITKINDAAREKIENTVLKYDKPAIDTMGIYIDEAKEVAETGEYVDESGIDIPKENAKKSGRYAWEEPKKTEYGKAKYITDEEFYENRDYDKYYLTMYSDGVIGDEMDEVVDPRHFGGEKLDIHGELKSSSDKSVYIRNDKLHQDFEVVLDYRDYYTAVGRHPN